MQLSTMSLTISQLKSKLSLPVIGSPLFIVSNPELVIEQCKAGIVGSFPALNARPAALLDTWLTRIKTELTDYQAANPAKKVAPFAVNQIVHHTNARLEEDMKVCVKHKVPVIITSLNSPKAIVKDVHAYGGLVFHDVTNLKHAKNALAAGVDGLILVCSVSNFSLFFRSRDVLNFLCFPFFFFFPFGLACVFPHHPFGLD